MVARKAVSCHESVGSKEQMVGENFLLLSCSYVAHPRKDSIPETFVACNATFVPSAPAGLVCELANVSKLLRNANDFLCHHSNYSVSYDCTGRLFLLIIISYICAHTLMWGGCPIIKHGNVNSLRLTKWSK